MDLTDSCDISEGYLSKYHIDIRLVETEGIPGKSQVVWPTEDSNRRGSILRP